MERIGKTETEDSKKKTFEWVANPKGIPEIYGNYLHVSWSLYDARILVGKLKPELGESGVFIVEEQASVTMAWAQVKNLARILGGMVEAYESVNGEITKPELAPRYEEINK